MKRILITFLAIFLTASITFAMPGYNPETDSKPKVYSTEYNDKLLKKLKDDYHKKYTVKVNDNYYIDTSPMGAYHKEVTCPYYEQYQNEYIYVN